MDARRGGCMCGEGEWTPAAAGVMDLARGSDICLWQMG